MSIVLSLKEKKYRFVYSRENKRMKEAFQRFKKCKFKKSKKQISREIKLCKDYWRCYPLHYFRYNLYRKDKELTDKELINYIPEFFFYQLFLSYYDSKKYSILTEEKNITELLFKGLNIGQPKSIFKLINGNFYDSNMNIRSTEYINDLLLKCNSKKVFVKPVDGEGGKGIYIFNKIDEYTYKGKSGTILNEAFLASIKEKDYIIQEGVEQHNFFSYIFPKSVNTFRIATEHLNGKVRIVCATLRVGKGENELDNGTQGGLVLGVNLDNGLVKDYAITETCEKYFTHPDTNFIFKGMEIPQWKKIKQFTIESARKLPQYTYLGWDIAVTSEEALAIETNLGFGLDHFQVPLGGLREKFRINSPDKYWRIYKSHRSDIK